MSDRRIRILIIGGYGFFGGNLVRLLAGEPRLTLIIAGRSEQKARDFCAGIPSTAEKIPAAFDRNGDVAERLRALSPDLVVDASGPFQNYGADPYRIARCAIAAGAHYLDLADATAFVAGIGVLDAEARSRGHFVLSGVSSFPVLTAAVVRRLCVDMAHVETIFGGIAPSPHADVGLNVLQAIASYAGQPVKLVRDGHPAIGYGLTEIVNFSVCPPGAMPLGRVRFSLIDVPDLQVLPAMWPDVATVWMGAGPVPEILHRALNGLAQLVRWRLLPSLTPLAPLFHRVIGLVRWGEHRGGMFVRVTGHAAEGSAVTRTWHMLAEGNDGPLIPSMACAAIVHRMLAGRVPEAGARPAIADLELSDYDALFASRSIITGVREEQPAGGARHPLYARVLSDAWAKLPEPIQRLHAMGTETSPRSAVAEGVATVERGHNPLARLAAMLFGFPAEGRNIPVQVQFDATTAPDGGHAELWTRSFAGKSFSSLQWAGEGRSEHLVNERFGPFTFGLAAVVEGERLRIIPRRWNFLGLPMPRFLMPYGDSHERAENGRFYFHVEICLPLIGLIVRYHGHLTPKVSA